MPNRVVTVYSKKPCVQCDATFKDMERKRVEFKVDDATTEDNLNFIMGLGHKQAPVVTVEENGVIVDHWSGFNPVKIVELAA